MKRASMRGNLVEIGQHSVIYSLSEILSKSVSFFMIPLYTNFLTPEDYGTLEILTLISFVAGMLTTMGITHSVVRIYFDDDDQAERDLVVSTALILMIALACSTFFVCALMSQPISIAVFGTPEYSTKLMLVFLALAIGLISEVPLTYLRIQERSISYSAIGLGRVLVSLILNIYFIAFLQLGIDGILLSSVLAAAVSAGLSLAATLPSLPLRYSSLVVKSLLAYGLPLIGSWIGMYILNFSDRFFLQRYVGLSEVGIYSLAYKFGMMPNVLIQSPFFLIWGTRQFSVARQADASQQFGRIFSYYMLIQASFWLILSGLVPDLLRNWSKDSFHDAARFVSLLTLSYVFFGIYQFVQFGLVLKKKTFSLGGLVLCVAAVNVVLNLLLIPKYHAMGATLSTLATFALLATVTARIARAYFAIAFEWRKLAILLATVAVFFLIIQLVPNSPKANTRLLINSALLICYAISLFYCGFFDGEEKVNLIRSFKQFVGLRTGEAPIRIDPDPETAEEPIRIDPDPETARRSSADSSIHSTGP